MLALAAIVPLVALQGTRIAINENPASCPSSIQMGQALEARLPGTLGSGGHDGAHDVLVLSVTTDTAGQGGQIVTLVDREGRVRLRRDLPSPQVTGTDDCPALADTIALMVERYLRDLGYRSALPPAPDVRPWELIAGAGWRPATTGWSAYELRLGLARRLGARGRFALALVAGAEGASRHEWPGASGRLRRFPFELRLAWRLELGPTSLESGPFAGGELLVMESHSSTATATTTRLTPVTGVGLGLRFSLGRAAFVRVNAALGASWRRFDFVTRETARDVVFGTEWVWGKMGIEAGVSFR